MNRQEIKHIIANYLNETMPLREALGKAEMALVEYEKLLQPCEIVAADYPEGYCTVHESDANSMYSDKCDAAKGAE